MLPHGKSIDSRWRCYDPLPFQKFQGNSEYSTAICALTLTTAATGTRGISFDQPFKAAFPKGL